MPLCISTRLWKLQGKMLHSTRRSLLNSGKWLGRRVEADFLLPPYNKSMCSFYTERDTEKIKAGGRQEGERRHSGAVYRPWYPRGVGSRSPWSQPEILFIFIFFLSQWTATWRSRQAGKWIFFNRKLQSKLNNNPGGKKREKRKEKYNKKTKKKIIIKQNRNGCLDVGVV